MHILTIYVSSNMASLVNHQTSLPLLLCLIFCSWLSSRFGIGGWIYIPGFFFGLGGSGMTAYKVYLAVMKQEKKNKRSAGAAFNEHK